MVLGQISVAFFRRDDFDGDLAVAFDDIRCRNGRFGVVRIFIADVVLARFDDILGAGPRFFAADLFLLHFRAAFVDHADALAEDFDDQVIVSIFFFDFLLQFIEILIMAQALDDFVSQIVALFFDKVRQRNDAAAAHFQDHIAERLVLGDGEAHGLHFIDTAVRVELDLEIDRIARADDDRRCRRIDDGRRLAGLRDIDGHVDVQDRIVDELIMFQDIQYIVKLVDTLFIDVIFGIIHIVPSNILIAAIGRADGIRQGRRATARAVDGLIDRIVHRRSRQDRRQFIVFNDLDALGHGRVGVRIPGLDDDGDARCQIAILAADAGAAVLSDLAHFGTDRAQLKGTGQVIDDRKDVGIVHEIIDAALFQEGMAKGDNLVVVDVSDRPDGTHLHIAVDEGCGDAAARFQGQGRTVAAGRSRIDRHEVIAWQFALHPRCRHAVEARRHERRRNGDER